MPDHRRQRSPTPSASGPSLGPATGLPAGPGFGPPGLGNAANMERLSGGRAGGGVGPGRADVGNAALVESLGSTGPSVAPAEITGAVAPAASTDPAATEVAPARAQPLFVGGTLKEGSEGADVEALQATLDVPMTGCFDAATKAAVIAFQNSHKLKPDGIAGSRTLTAMGLRNAPTSATGAAQKAPPPAAAPAAPAAAAKQPSASGATGSDTPAWAQRPNVSGTLKEGSEGPDVEALQAALNIPVTGKFDAATKAAVVTYQVANKLGKDGVAGRGTLTKLGLRDELRSKSHTDTAFIPKYRATAYSESDMYRTKSDPYAVGAITKPSQEDDDGGKTYGTYQFESYVYKDGSKAKDSKVSGSTLLRFVNWADNPYKAQLAAVVKAHGIASEEFDTLWTSLTTTDNKAFGQAQERFLEHDVAAKVTEFFEAAKVPASLRKDPDLYDLAMGTINQYGALLGTIEAGVAKKLAPLKAPTAADVGRAIQDVKEPNVEANFRSSPNAWEGVHERITRERALFDA